MHETMRSGSSARIGDFAAIDGGDIRGAIAVYQNEGREAEKDASLFDLLWLAEMSLYLGALDETHRLLSQIDDDARMLADPGSDGAVARRRQLIAAELMYFEHKGDDAMRLAIPVAEASVSAKDRMMELRARYDVGRFARRQGEHTKAIEHLAAAATIASELSNSYYRGLISFDRAVALSELNETAAAERRCVEAIELLTQTENLRYRALAESTYGVLLTDLGRYADALESLERAEATSSALAIASDTAAIRGNVARTMLALGRHTEAIGRLAGILEFERAQGDKYGELNTLMLLARAELTRKNVEAAERHAAGALVLAEEVGSAAERLDAKLLAGRMAGLLGRPEAPDNLRAILEEVDETGTEHQRAEARLYLAESLIDPGPIEAEQLLIEARELPAVAASDALSRELEAIDAARLAAPVHVTADGKFVIDVQLGWPQLKNARDALERFVVTRALDETGGNGAAAGRLIGETRYQMHYLKRIFERGEGRPSRATVPVEEAEEGATPRGRRSKSRPKRLVRRR